MRRRSGPAMKVSSIARISRASTAITESRVSLDGKYQSKARIIAAKQPVKYAYTLAIACAMTPYRGGSFLATPINQTKPAPIAGRRTPIKNCQFMPAPFLQSFDRWSGNSKGPSIPFKEGSYG